MPLPPGTYTYEGTVTVRIYAKKADVWQTVADQVVSIYSQEYYSDGGLRNFAWSWDGTYQMGTGVQAIGLSIVDFSGASAAIQAFTNVMFQAQAAGAGERSATPAGQKSTVTVRP